MQYAAIMFVTSVFPTPDGPVNRNVRGLSTGLTCMFLSLIIFMIWSRISSCPLTGSSSDRSPSSEKSLGSLCPVAIFKAVLIMLYKMSVHYDAELGRNIVDIADEYCSNDTHRPDNAVTLIDRAAADVIIEKYKLPPNKIQPYSTLSVFHPCSMLQ